MKINPKVLLGLCNAVAFACLQSCDGGADPIVPPGEEGFYVVNEGAYGNNNASLSFYDRQTDQVINDVFQSKNGRALGDQAQSMTIFDGRGYIVVQNSGKVEVIDISDNSSIKTIIDDIESPRYFLGVTSTKGYLTDWGADGITGTLKVIDLQTLSVVKTIPVGQGPNKMLMTGPYVYVANSGGFGKDNTIALINHTTDELASKIKVGDNPNSLQLDKSNYLWIACAGNLVYNQDFSINESQSTKGSIVKFANGSTEYPFSKFTYSTVANLEISPDGGTLYFTFDGAVYSMATASPKIPTAPFINQSYYGMSVDPFTGDIIGGSAPNFSSVGKIEVWNSDGTTKETYTVGIAPNGCAFK